MLPRVSGRGGEEVQGWMEAMYQDGLAESRVVEATVAVCEVVRGGCSRPFRRESAGGNGTSVWQRGRSLSRGAA